MSNVSKFMPVPERGSIKRIFAGIVFLIVAISVLYYGNVYVEHIMQRLEGRTFGPLLFGSVFSVMIHAYQVLLLVLSWIMIGRGVGYLYVNSEPLVSIVASVFGVMICWLAMPRLSPLLAYTFPLNIFLLLILIILFQLLTLHVENWVDKGVALLLWIFSFQSLELLPVFPSNSDSFSTLFKSMYESSEEAAIASMSGMALFMSFLAGAIISTWLLARYSSKLNQVRQLWRYAPRRADEDGAREVNMVEIRSLVHDLKNPLAAIKGMAFMMYGEQNPEKEKADVIMKATEYMERMIGEILHEDQRAPIEIGKFFDSLASHIAPFPWGEYVSIEISPDAQKTVVSLNEVRFMRALLNVMDNAWRANRIAGSKDIEVFVRRNSQFLEIEIKDHGPGYTERADKYHRSGWGSTGLGLAFTRREITAHSGSLMLSQRTDGVKGASVMISLPLNQPSA